MSRRILVIHNPAAGQRNGRRLDTAVVAMREHGAHVVVEMTSAAGEAERIAAESGGHDVVVASGGDGTVNEVVNGLAGLPVAPALAILPLGTANVLARELGYPKSFAAIGALAAIGRRGEIHLGTCNGRWFTLMVGAGFDAGVVARVDLRLKRALGRAAYACRAALDLLAPARPACTVSVDGGTPVSVVQVIVSKGRSYGGSFTLAPGGSLLSPGFEVCLFERARRRDLLAYLAGVVFGFHHRLPGFRIVSGREVVIEGLPGEVVQVDGDVGPPLPVAVLAGQRTLPVILPD